MNHPLPQKAKALVHGVTYCCQLIWLRHFPVPPTITPTAFGLDGPGIKSRWSEIFRTSPDWPTQPPLQWVPGLSRG